MTDSAIERDEARLPNEDPVEGRPVLVGRMLLLSRVGEGGMGVVYSAYDPELDRKVAVKMIRPDRTANPTSRARLLREAQALARLSHPNVVAIHDVGTHGEHVWLAMELVQGKTVRAWLAERPRGWREVLAVFKQAARGIEAAHRVDLLHRDLKPANIMIGDDGRVRVMDFGLAREAPGERDDTGDPVPGAASELTLTTSLLGTPAYMAPEQLLGLPSDVRSDQFSLCVALWEALYGERPFVDGSFASRAPAVLAGKRSPPPRGIRVPHWLRRVAERGLSPAREQRYASMTELLAALDADPARRIWALGVCLALGVGATAWLGARQIVRAKELAACAEAGAAIDEVWNDEARARLRDGLLASGVDDAAATFERVVPPLDEHARAWRAARSATCRAATVDHTLAPALAEAKQQCLDERRLFLQSMIDVLATASDRDHARGIVQSAVPAVGTLLPVSACDDENWLRIRPHLPEDADARDEVERLRAMLAQSSALLAAGLARDSLVVGEQIQAAADALGWPPLSAAAALQRGEVLSELADHKSAQEALESAFYLAGAVGEDEVALAAAGKLAFVVGDQQHMHAEGHRWARTAQMLLQRANAAPDDVRWVSTLSRLAMSVGNLDEYEQALAYYERALGLARASLGDAHPRVGNILHSMGIIAKQQGRLDQALELHQRSLAVRETALPPEHPDVAASYNSIGVIQSMRGDRKQAIASFGRARDVWTAAFGPEHPKAAGAMVNLGNAYADGGDLVEAIEQNERAIEIFEKHYGADSPKLAAPLANSASIYREIGDHERAIAYSERALGIQELKFGANNPELAGILTNLGSIYEDLGRYEQALAAHDRARAIYEGKFGSEDTRLAAVFNNIGMVHLDMKNFRAAVEHYERALKILEAVEGPRHPRTAIALTGIAAGRIGMNQAEAAKPLLERAIEIRRATDDNPDRLAWAEFMLAKVLWSEPGGRARARELAVEARELYHRAGTWDNELAEIEAWLAKHGE